MPHQENTQRTHDARDLWRRSRRLGDPTAVFRPGEELRCPGTNRHLAEGPQPCGASFSEYAKPHTRVIIRVRTAQLPELPHLGTNLKCHKCGTALEKLTILEAPE
jgi:hypothetical protein